MKFKIFFFFFFFFFFLKVLPNFEFEVNFSIQWYAYITRENPVHLQITYYLRYTKLKSFFVHRV